MTVKRLVGYFVRGCLVLVPAGLTFYILFAILRTIDQLLPIGIPGVGLLLTLILVTLVGVLTSNVVGRSVFETSERALRRLPLVKLIYSSIKDLINAFMGDKKSFNRPVAVTLHPGSGLKALGFVTRDGLHALDMPLHVAVYFPQSYNFAGYLAVVAREQVEALDVNSAELMTFIISGGVSGLGVGQSVLPPASMR
ncbi:MAG TPA: DUF502 domain-containing protein [Polyangiaceae bacterium]|jgi:uncharacterized membrane protein|nr:DUF502 domain-containing protein [Polyangiaceae bacterium]